MRNGICDLSSLVIIALSFWSPALKRTACVSERPAYSNFAVRDLAEPFQGVLHEDVRAAGNCG